MAKYHSALEMEVERLIRDDLDYDANDPDAVKNLKRKYEVELKNDILKKKKEETMTRIIKPLKELTQIDLTSPPSSFEADQFINNILSNQNDLFTKQQKRGDEVINYQRRYQRKSNKLAKRIEAINVGKISSKFNEFMTMEYMSSEESDDNGFNVLPFQERSKLFTEYLRMLDEKVGEGKSDRAKQMEKKRKFIEKDDYIKRLPKGYSDFTSAEYGFLSN